MALTTAFALSPGWWIVVAAAIVLLIAIGYSLSTERGSGMTPRPHRRPTSATPAPGADGEAQVTGRDPVRQRWERRQRSAHRV